MIPRYDTCGTKFLYDVSYHIHTNIINHIFTQSHTPHASKKINDNSVKDSSDLFRILDTKNVGDSVSITVERNGKSKDFEITLGALSE